MSEQRPVPAGSIRPVALVAVGVGVAALSAAAFVWSYPGLHAFALHAGISARLAKGYPVIFDVLLVVILAAVLSLRTAGLPSRTLAWSCLLVLLVAAAGADALHAAGRTLPSQAAAVTAAVVPWAVLLIAFGLLLAMLRHARLHRAAVAAGPAGAGQPAAGPRADTPSDNGGRGAEPPPLIVPVQRAAAPQVTSAPAADAVYLSGMDVLENALEAHGELAADADPPLDDPAGDSDGAGADEAADESPEEADSDMPVFHRVWSSPTPPDPES